MNQKTRQSKCISKKKNSYAPIMLTSKAIKPIERQDNLQYYLGNKPLSPHKFRSKISKFIKPSSYQHLNKDQPELNQTQINSLNYTQHNFNYQSNGQVDKTFSQSCKKARFIEVSNSQLILAQNKQGSEEIYNNTQKSKVAQVQFQPFQMRQPSPSTVVKVQFTQQNKGCKFIRKNNTNSNNKYNILLSTNSSASSTNRPYKSVSAMAGNVKVDLRENLSAFKGDNKQVLVQATDEGSVKMTSSSALKKQHSVSNRTFEDFLLLKDPRKMILPPNKQPLDLTFINFKQKIYQKKVNKLSNKRSKCSQEWNQYLNKYYLNIKKVKPMMRINQQAFNNSEQNSMTSSTDKSNKVSAQNKTDKFNRESKSSVDIFLNKIRNEEINKIKNQEMSLGQQIAEHVSMNDNQQQQTHLSNNYLHAQRIERMRSSTHIIPSKTTSVLGINNEASPQASPKRVSKTFNDSEQSKIQSDILTRRTNPNKKQHFVFGMGDSSSANKNQNPTVVKFSLYKDFLFKVNFSNSLYVKFPDDIQKPYKFFVGRGNNSAIIKGIMRRRFWWQLVDKVAPQVNFLWTQLKVSDYVKCQKKQKPQQFKPSLDMNNSHHNSSSQLKQNDPSYSLFQQTHQLNKKVLKGYDLQLWLSHYKHNQKHEDKFVQQPSSVNILKKRLKTVIKRKRLTFIDPVAVTLQRSHNHFQCNYFIGNKKALFYAMRKYYRLYGEDPFDYIPLTFHISGGLEDPQYNQFLQKYNQITEEKTKNKFSDIKNIWIVKPGEVTNRGRGITVCATLDQIKIRLKSKEKNSDGSLRTYILQKYIQKPLLYQKRKFDIRHYMLMTCINGQIKGYWYEQGYIRTTSTEYNIKNCKDLYTHLTNDAIQKNSQDYGKYQKGNKISYDEFSKYLQKTYKKDYQFSEQILPKMKRQATDAMRATYWIMQPNRRQNNFQLFGLDFMLDEGMNVYLIECNTNPCLQLSCPLLSKIISTLIESVFKICIDPLFPPPYQWLSSKKYQLGDNALEGIKFQMVFDEAVDGGELDRLYAKERGFGSKIGKVEQEEQEYEDDEKEDDEWNEDNIAP